MFGESVCKPAARLAHIYFRATVACDADDKGRESSGEGVADGEIVLA